MSSVCTLSLNR